VTARATVADLAAEQYRTRQTRAATVVRNGGMTRTEAERHLRPWLAIACTAGATLPDLAPLLTELDEINRASSHTMFPGALRWIAAEEICPRAIWAPVLARARNAAFDRFLEQGNDANMTVAANLQRIALALQHDINGHHVPPYTAPADRPQQVAA
jgi:hypothetical protein